MELSEEEKKAVESLNEILFENAKEITLYELGINDLKIILNLIEKQQKYIKKLEKYDSRKFIKEENKIKSPSFKKEEVDFMNLGIAIYENFDEIYNDNESEEDI